jgi:hypothetical protein
MQTFEAFEKQFTDDHQINQHYSSSFIVVDIKNWDIYSKLLIESLGIETLDSGDHELSNSLVRLSITNKDGKFYVMWCKISK